MIIIIANLTKHCCSNDIPKSNEGQTKIDLTIPSVFCALLSLSHQNLLVLDYLTTPKTFLATSSPGQTNYCCFIHHYSSNYIVDCFAFYNHCSLFSFYLILIQFNFQLNYYQHFDFSHSYFVRFTYWEQNLAGLSLLFAAELHCFKDFLIEIRFHKIHLHSQFPEFAAYSLNYIQKVTFSSAITSRYFGYSYCIN